MEALAPLRHLEQPPRRLEALAVPPGVPFEQLDDRPRTPAVGAAERTAAKRREAEAEDRPHVAVVRTVEDPLLETAHRLVDHLEDAALGDLGRLDLRRAEAEQLIDRRIDPLRPSPVGVEPLAGLAPEPAVREQAREHLRSLDPFAEGLSESPAGVSRDVQADLVEESERSDRKAPVLERRVHLLDRGAFAEQPGRFVQERREDPAGVETGAVLDHDQRLAEPAT